MQHYCTLFNVNYLSRAMVMYDSLERTGADFHLFVFAFDDTVYDFLSGKGKQDKITVISLVEFQDEALLAVKPGRSAAEYCWTCTPSILLYSITKFNLPSCTYIDADLFFFSDPLVLIEEMKERSVLLTEHRFTKAYEKGAENGMYCVQFMTFKSDVNGMTALRWWRDECIKWCYARAEDGKFGDQKYLDDWLIRFRGVHVLENLGGGVAPWNVQQYNFQLFSGTELFGTVNGSDNSFRVIFFHFHSLKFYQDNTVLLSYYPTPSSAFNLVYAPYINLLLSKEKELAVFLPGIDTAGKSPAKAKQHALAFSDLIQFYWQDLKTAVRFLLGTNVRKRKISQNIYSNESFR